MAHLILWTLEGIGSLFGERLIRSKSDIDRIECQIERRERNYRRQTEEEHHATFA